MKIKHYPQSAAIEQLLARTGSDNGRILHGRLVERMREASVAALNETIQMIEGFMEALWYDIAAPIVPDPEDGVNIVNHDVSELWRVIARAFKDLGRSLDEYAHELQARAI